MTYIRAEKSQIDSWGTIGNPGWSWDDLFTYYKKSEDLTQPTVAQIESGATFDPNDHGEDGYLKVGWPNGLVGGPLHTIVKETWNALGLPLNLDVNSGSVRGFSVWPSTLDAEANVREDAARAYYQPIQARPNLHVYLNTTATNIIWADDAVNAVATGVELISSDGSTKILTCKKEVILSAGALRSPAILELSGIGNPE